MYFLLDLWLCTKADYLGELKCFFLSRPSSFRFHEHWRFVLQRLAFLAAFVVYLESETLVTREEVARILGSKYRFTCEALCFAEEKLPNSRSSAHPP